MTVDLYLTKVQEKLTEINDISGGLTFSVSHDHGCVNHAHLYTTAYFPILNTTIARNNIFHRTQAEKAVEEHITVKAIQILMEFHRQAFLRTGNNDELLLFEKWSERLKHEYDS